MTTVRHASENLAKSRADRVGLGHVGLHRRGHDGTRLKRFHGAGVKISPLLPQRTAAT